MMNTKIKTYSELLTFETFEDRFEYLKLLGFVGDPTFGPNRYFNQKFYNSDPEWLAIRDFVIDRDNGCDMAIQGLDISSYITIHHINPITMEDIANRRACLFDPENLVCVSSKTHRAIHYSKDSAIVKPFAVRSPNDQCPWKK